MQNTIKGKKLRSKRQELLVCVVLFLGLISCSVFLRGNPSSVDEVASDPGLLQARSSGSTYTLDWCVTWEGLDTDSGRDIIFHNGYIYVAGTYYDAIYNNDIMLAKYAPSSDQIWNITWGLIGVSDQPYALAIDSNDNIFVAGNIGTNTAGLIKFNSSGGFLWNRSWTYPGGAIATDVVIDTDGSDEIYLAVTSNDLDLVLLKYSNGGSLIWQYTYDSGGTDGFLRSTILISSGCGITTRSHRCPVKPSTKRKVGTRYVSAKLKHSIVRSNIS